MTLVLHLGKLSIVGFWASPLYLTKIKTLYPQSLEPFTVNKTVNHKNNGMNDGNQESPSSNDED